MKEYIKSYPDVQWEDVSKPVAPISGGRRPGSSMAKARVQPALTDPTDGLLPAKPKGLYGLYYSPLWEQLMKDLNLRVDRPITKTPRPATPAPVWTQNESTGFAIKVDLPDAQTRRTYWRQLMYWRLLRMAAKPVNLCKRIVRHQKRVHLLAPRQVSLVFQGHSLFGAALVSAVRGGACRPGQPLLTLCQLFAHIHSHMNIVLDKVNNTLKPVDEEEAEQEHSGEQTADTNAYLRRKKKKKDKKPNPSPLDASSDPNASRRRIAQTACLYLPKGDVTCLSFPVAYACGAPAAPERPFILQTLPTSVLIEWFNPPFDGVLPSLYKIYMRNVTRNFHHWEEVYYPGGIAKTQFLIRNLPIGVACQFKVSAFNNGGWGAASMPTSYVTPGEEQAEITQEMRWHRVRQGGVLAVLDQMKKYSINAEEQLIGLRILLGLGLCSSGYKSTKFALQIAEQCLTIARAFGSHHPDLLAYVFRTLTCCLLGKAERKVRQLLNVNHLDDILSRAMAQYRHDPGVVNAAQGLRAGNMANYLPPVPKDCKLKILFPAHEDKDESAEESDDDDEEDGNQDNKEIGLQSMSIG